MRDINDPVIDSSTLQHGDDTPCAGPTCAWWNSGGHVAVHALPCTLCSLGYLNAGYPDSGHEHADNRPKVDIDQEDLDKAASLVLSQYDEAATLILQSSDQHHYGFTVQQIKDGDNYEIGESDDLDEVNDLLTNLAWNSVVGEDKTGHAYVRLHDYDNSNSASVQHFIDTGRYLKRGEVPVEQRDVELTLTVAEARGLVDLLTDADSGLLDTPDTLLADAIIAKISLALTYIV